MVVRPALSWRTGSRPPPDPPVRQDVGVRPDRTEEKLRRGLAAGYALAIGLVVLAGIILMVLPFVAPLLVEGPTD